MHATRDDFSRYPFQLARLMSDPWLDLWIGPEQREQFVAAELERLDPASAQIAQAEARWLAHWHRSDAERA